MIMGEGNEVDILEIHMERLGIMEKNITLRSSIEQNGLLCPCDDAGKSPIRFQTFTERVVVIQDSDG